MTKRSQWLTILALAGSVSGQALAQQQANYGPGPQGAPAEQIVAGPIPSPEMPPAPPPAADPGPRVAVAHRIIDAAGAFDGYMHRALAIRPGFRDGGAVAHAVALGSVYDPDQLEQGAVAYVALAALQDPSFVQSIREVGVDPRARDALAGRLAEHPELVLGSAAAREEASRASALLGRMGAQLVAAGAAVQQASYDVQAQDWSRGAIVGPGERLARIKAQSAIAVSLMPADTDHLINDLTALRTTDAETQPEAQAVTMAVTRGLALAALAVLGRAGEDQSQAIAALMSDPVDAHCIKMAKLDLFQCLAVAGPHYENLYCLGHHGMMDTGKCVASAAGLDEAALPSPTDPRSVLVPVAFASAASGPERSSAFGPPRPTGVGMPVAAPEPPANYSPYAGPSER